MPKVIQKPVYFELEAAGLLDRSRSRFEEEKAAPRVDLAPADPAIVEGIGPNPSSLLHWQGTDTLEELGRSGSSLWNVGLTTLRHQVADGLEPEAPATGAVEASTGPGASSGPELTAEGNGLPFVGLEALPHVGMTLKLSGMRGLAGIADNDGFWDGLQLTIRVGDQEITVHGRDIWDPANSSASSHQLTPTRSLVGSAIIHALRRAGIEARWGDDLLGGTLIHLTPSA